MFKVSWVIDFVCSFLKKLSQGTKSQSQNKPSWFQQNFSFVNSIGEKFYKTESFKSFKEEGEGITQVDFAIGETECSVWTYLVHSFKNIFVCLSLFIQSMLQSRWNTVNPTESCSKETLSNTKPQGSNPSLVSAWFLQLLPAGIVWRETKFS